LEIIDKGVVNWNLYIKVIIAIFLLTASYFDIKASKIPNKLNMIIFILRLLIIPMTGFNLNSIYGLILGLLIILIPAMVKNRPMGGDIKTIAVSGFYLGVHNIFVLIAGTIIFFLIYHIPAFLNKKVIKDTPLAPFIFISFICMNIISFID